MKLLIGIATFKRIDKLKRLLKSLKNQTYQNFRIEVVCDNNDFETSKFLVDSDIKNYVQNYHKFVIGAWNKIVQQNINNTWDGWIGLCDDVELHPNALQIIVNQHKDHFYDTDGVLGFKQECPEHPEYSFKWFGQTLMGRKFIERYAEANYQICCPDYFHFCQDAEMYDYAHSLYKFFSCEGAVLNHYHPGFIKDEVDETHNIIRSGNVSPKNKDFKMQIEREKLGYLWGKDFNLIGKDKL